MTGVSPFVLGWVFFPLLYSAAKRITSFYVRDDASIAKIAEKSVSIVQAIMASIAGVVIATSCTNDIMYDRHWLVEAYMLFALPYQMCDIYAMYTVHLLRNSHLQSRKVQTAVLDFVKNQPIMVLHHLFIIFFFFPVAYFLRNGKGDFFVGCFFFVEMANPFMNFRAILKQFGYENTKIGITNGIVLLITFCICRIMIFPFIYNVYGRPRDLSMWKVALHIPVKCNVGCAIILAFNLYWFYLILGAACRTVKNLR